MLASEVRSALHLTLRLGGEAEAEVTSRLAHQTLRLQICKTGLGVDGCYLDVDVGLSVLQSPDQYNNR